MISNRFSQFYPRFSLIFSETKSLFWQDVLALKPCSRAAQFSSWFLFSGEELFFLNNWQTKLYPFLSHRVAQSLFSGQQLQKLPSSFFLVQLRFLSIQFLCLKVHCSYFGLQIQLCSLQLSYLSLSWKEMFCFCSWHCANRWPSLAPHSVRRSFNVMPFSILAKPKFNSLCRISSLPLLLLCGPVLWVDTSQGYCTHPRHRKAKWPTYAGWG